MQKFIIYISSVLLLLACQKAADSGHGPIDSGFPAKVSCKLSVSSLDISATKTNNTIDENSVADLWVLQFNGQEDASVLVKADYYSAPQITNMNLNLLTGSGQSVYFIANTGNNTLFNSANAPLNSYAISTLKARTITYTSENNNFTLISGKYYLPMTGIYQGDITANGTSISASLSRLSAKITLNYTCTLSLKTGEVGAIIKVTSIALKSVPAVSSYLSNPSNSTVAEPSSTIDYPSPGSGIGQTSGYAVFYMPENIRGQVSSNTSALQKAGTAPTKSTYLEITGEYFPYGAYTSTKTVIYKIFIGKNSITDYNINSNASHSINLSITGIDITDSRITTIGDPVSPANCHIIAPNSTINIPIGIKGNGGDVAGTGLPTTHTAASIAVLWQTSNGLITLSSFNSTAQTVCATASGSPGNAVIAAYSGANGTGNILWSWHIWVTSYNPNTGTIYNFNTSNPLDFMDRNLGATDNTPGQIGTIGLVYQWGRKDPFPGSTTLTSSSTEATLYGKVTSINYREVSVNNNIDSSYLKPNIFYFKSTSPYDWFSNSTNKNDALWGGASATTPTAKTIFDPCPAGWRVPPFRSGYSPWTGLYNSNGTYANYGWTWTNPYNAGYWSLNGYRNGCSGIVGSANSEGGCWSATVSGTNSYNLYLNNTYPTSTNTLWRGYGFAVRCVKEFTL